MIGAGHCHAKGVFRPVQLQVPPLLTPRSLRNQHPVGDDRNIAMTHGIVWPASAKARITPQKNQTSNNPTTAIHFTHKQENKMPLVIFGGHFLSSADKSGGCDFAFYKFCGEGLRARGGDRFAKEGTFLGEDVIEGGGKWRAGCYWCGWSRWEKWDVKLNLWLFWFTLNGKYFNYI